jgi:hypothetical protein
MRRNELLDATRKKVALTPETDSQRPIISYEREIAQFRDHRIASCPARFGAPLARRSAGQFEYLLSNEQGGRRTLDGRY